MANVTILDVVENKYLMDTFLRNDTHIDRVSLYTEYLLAELLHAKSRCINIPKHDFPKVVTASKLHDIGKALISEEILYKRTKLTAFEYEHMKSHTTMGVQVIKDAFVCFSDAVMNKYAIQIAESHHERWDGRGYPKGLQGEHIPFAAQVVSIADAYDSARVFKQGRAALSHNNAVALIAREKGGAFNPEITEAFLTIHNKFQQIFDGMTTSYKGFIS